MTDAPYSGANTRRNIVAFLIGKVPNALLTVAILGMFARTLPAEEFGRYVLVMAMVDIVLGTSTLGLDWVLLRYAPVYRLNGCRRGLAQLIGGVVVARCLILLLVALLLASAAPLLAGIGYALPLPLDLIAPFGVLLVIEGGLRILRDNTLEALALQSRLQLVLVARGLTILVSLWIFTRYGTVEAVDLLMIEVGAAALGLLLSLAVVTMAVVAMRADDAPWKRPTWRQMRDVALLYYASGIIEYLYSPTFLILLLARFESAAAIGGLGFALRLTDIVRNYLPGMLVFGLVRARMIGAYVKSQNYEELRMWAQFLYKVSLLTLLPVMGLVFIQGEEILALASAGRYAQYHLLFAMLCCWLALRLHRLILGVVFNATELMSAWAGSSLLSAMVLPVIYFLGRDWLGVWFVVVALFGNEIIVGVLAVLTLRRRGLEWTVGMHWISRAVLATATGAALAAWLPRNSLWGLAGAAILLGLSYCACVLLFGVFDKTDRQLVNRSVGRTLFR